MAVYKLTIQTLKLTIHHVNNNISMIQYRKSKYFGNNATRYFL